MRDAGEEPADRRHFTNQGSDGKRAPAPPAGRRRPVHRHRGKGETPGGGKGNCARSEGSPHPPARGGRAAPQGDPREDGAGRSGADAGVSTAPWKGRAGEAETPGRGGRGKAENRKSGGRSPGGTGAPMVSAAGRRRGGSGGARRPSRGPAERSAGLGRPPVPGRPQDAGTWAPRADESPSGLEAQRQWGGRQDSNPDSLLKQINIEETVKKMVSQEPVLRELWVRPSPKNQGDRRGGEEQVGHQSPGWQ